MESYHPQPCEEECRSGLYPGAWHRGAQSKGPLSRRLYWLSHIIGAQQGWCPYRPHFTEEKPKPRGGGLPKVTEPGDACPGAGAGGQALLPGGSTAHLTSSHLSLSEVQEPSPHVHPRLTPPPRTSVPSSVHCGEHLHHCREQWSSPSPHHTHTQAMHLILLTERTNVIFFPRSHYYVNGSL